MFERAARRGFARTSIRSYQTTVLIEFFVLESTVDEYLHTAEPKRLQFACKQ